MGCISVCFVDERAGAMKIILRVQSSSDLNVLFTVPFLVGEWLSRWRNYGKGLGELNLPDSAELSRPPWRAACLSGDLGSGKENVPRRHLPHLSQLLWTEQDP